MELRGVLLGKHESGKTSVINSILGNTFTEVKREGLIDGTKLSLIETPGWWNTFSLNDLSKISKQELVRRVSLVTPGPHVILITIRADSVFSNTDEKFLEDYMELLGPKIWTRTLVIFTRGDVVPKETIERNIQEAGSGLSRLIEKCENNYHVFNNKMQQDRTQVTELIKKIQGIVRRNEESYLEIDMGKVKDVNEQWEETERRARSRKSRVEHQRSKVQEKAPVQRLEEIGVVLMGWVLSGKSSTGNIILNRDEFVIGRKTGKAMRGHGEVDGRNITVLDTPGWWKYIEAELNPDFVRSTILESVLESKSPQALLLVIPGDTSFQEEQKRIVEENLSVLGEDVWRHTIVLFTWGDRFADISIEQHIESEGDALQWLVEKCRNRYHVFDNTNKTNRDQVSELFQIIDEMAAENSTFFFIEKTNERNDKQDNPILEIRLKDINVYLEEGFKMKAEEIRDTIENLCMQIIDENDEIRSKEIGVKFRDQGPDHQEPLPGNNTQQVN
ncbi:hypothetical protein DNTS_026836, partial [Danionella cerebrum]